MISYVFLVLSFAFVNCKSFHANQHIPVQQYQPALQYSSPLPAYPQQYIPIFNPALQRQGDPNAPLTSDEIEELQRQYQQWQISLPNQQQGGTVWISAPQYYYPQSSNYPQVPYPPGPPGAPSPPPQSGQPSQSSQPPQQPANPSLAWSRETSGTTPSNGSSPITNPPTGEPFNPFPTQPAEQSTVTTESTSTFAPITESSTTEFSGNSSSESSTIPSSTTSESSNATSTTTPNFTTDLPASSTSSNSTELPSNTTSSTTPKPSNATSNATSNNPLLKYCSQPRGQFKSEDCGKFVNCWDDVAIEQECPAGLYFNTEKQYCDYPQNVDCGNRTTSRPGSNNSTNTTNPIGSNNSTSNPEGSFNSTNSKCPQGYGTYRNESNCAAFYVCVGGEPVDFNCPPGTNYNSELKVCDYPYRVDCKGAPSIPIAEESSTTNVTETPPPSETSNSTSSTSNSSSSTTPASSSSSSPASSSTSSSSTTASSTSTTEPSTSTITISSSSSEASTTQLSSSTLPPAPVTTTSGEFPQGPPPPPVDPIGYYNFNLKKLPESIVNTGVRCYHANVYRLTPDCSSVTVCQDGLNYIVNCASGTSFDAYTQRCVPTFRARC